MKHYTCTDSALGRMLLTSDGHALTGLYFVAQKYQAMPPEERADEPRAEPFAQLRAELAEYFAGARQRFDLALAPEGTRFQRRVWRALAAIPFGATVSYLGLARSLGAPHSVRAVAGAVGRNPISVLIPCHRVIGSDGSLTGYARRTGAQAQIACAGSRRATVTATPDPENPGRHRTRRAPDVSSHLFCHAGFELERYGFGRR